MSDTLLTELQLVGTIGIYIQQYRNTELLRLLDIGPGMCTQYGADTHSIKVMKPMTAGFDHGLRRLKYARSFTEVHIDVNCLCNRTRRLGDTSKKQNCDNQMN